ncbi:MAG: hypothetical protein KJ799_02385 [Bacteroidetes bacterium]|nr:hypothetical protein [Bacteroidota bacterium]MBU2505559.1 hypothetical protein [Bacteroidota bacterium]
MKTKFNIQKKGRENLQTIKTIFVMDLALSFLLFFVGGKLYSLSLNKNKGRK